jgi:hypothetical protein
VSASHVRFVEEQRFTQVWIRVLVLAATIVAWVAVVTIVVDGNDDEWFGAVVAGLLGIALPVLFLLARLVVEVHDERIVIRYRPFTTRSIDLDSVTAVESVTYRPLREYGGWGIKGWSRRKVAYNVRGDRGALLTLSDGRTVLLGSQQPDALAGAIRRAMAGR